MANNDRFTFTSAARSLALPVDGSDDEEPILPTRRSTENSWQRRSRSSFSSNAGLRPRTTRDKWLQNAEKWQRRAQQTWYHFTPVQRAGIIVLNIVLCVMAILFLVYNERIFAWLSPFAKRWRNMSFGWLILWLMTFGVSFPPMIGYSTCVTIAGFVFGMKGWFIISTASVVGATCAFLVSRTVLRDFVSRLTEKNQRFAALSLVLKHDGLKLLIMIRICPLPFSLSNGAISTIPTVTWQNFAIATAVATPKLLLHVFVGSRLGDLAENGDKMDTRTKIVSYVSIVIGIVAGLLTGYLVYVRTKARATQLEAEEAAAAVAGRRTSGAGVGGEYIDDPDEREAVDVLRRMADDISLRHTEEYVDHVLRRREDDISLHHTEEFEDLEGGVYRDEFTDDEDAVERDVFDEGDGGYEDEEIEAKKSER